jgi:hypothetical protein
VEIGKPVISSSKNMDIDKLHKLINEARWFSRVGSATHGHLPLLSVLESSNWGWLPTSREQLDPIHGDSLTKHREVELAAAKLVLPALRHLPESVSALTDGPHDYTNAAKGGAQFAARMAAREIGNGQAGTWCLIIELFSRGWWPCGLTTTGDLVVY